MTLLSVADRLATRGERAEQATDAHLRLARSAAPRGPALASRRTAAARRCAATSSHASSASRRDPASGELLGTARGAATPASSQTREQALRYARALLGSV